MIDGRFQKEMVHKFENHELTRSNVHMDRVEGVKDVYEAMDVKIDSQKVLDFVTDCSVGVASI